MESWQILREFSQEFNEEHAKQAEDPIIKNQSVDSPT